MDAPKPAPAKPPTPGPSHREPYESPAVVAEATFETLALACGKEDEQSFDCFLTGGASS